MYSVLMNLDESETNPQINSKQKQSLSQTQIQPPRQSQDKSQIQPPIKYYKQTPRQSLNKSKQQHSRQSLDKSQKQHPRQALRKSPDKSQQQYSGQSGEQIKPNALQEKPIETIEEAPVICMNDFPVLHSRKPTVEKNPQVLRYPKNRGNNILTVQIKPEPTYQSLDDPWTVHVTEDELMLVEIPKEEIDDIPLPKPIVVSCEWVKKRDGTDEWHKTSTVVETVRQFWSAIHAHRSHLFSVITEEIPENASTNDIAIIAQKNKKIIDYTNNLLRQIIVSGNGDQTRKKQDVLTRYKKDIIEYNNMHPVWSFYFKDAVKNDETPFIRLNGNGRSINDVDCNFRKMLKRENGSSLVEAYNKDFTGLIPGIIIEFSRGALPEYIIGVTFVKTLPVANGAVYDGVRIRFLCKDSNRKTLESAEKFIREELLRNLSSRDNRVPYEKLIVNSTFYNKYVN